MASPTRKKKAARKKARKPARKKKTYASPSKKAKQKRAAGRKAGKRKPDPVVDPRPHSDLLEEVPIADSAPGAGDAVPSFVQRYEGAIMLGMRKKERAFFAGCDPSTPREWEELALEDFEAGRETVFTEFYIMCRRAETQRIALGLGTIRAARAAGDWRAAAWELERNGYGAPTRVQVSGSIQTGSFPTDDQDDEIAASVAKE